MKGDDANLLFLTYNRQSVPQREYNFLHTIVCGYQIIECFYADSLLVCAVRLFFEYVSVPQGIVGYDIASFRKTRQHHFIIIDVTALIAVDKSKVESDSQPGHKLQGVAYIELYLTGIGRVLQPGTGEVFLLVIDFERVLHPIVRQSLRHAKRGISAICPDFQYLAGTYHPDKHLEHTPLQMSRSHTGIKQFKVRIARKSFQIFALVVNVAQDVLV